MRLTVEWRAFAEQLVQAMSAAIPAELQSFLASGKRKFRCDDGDWEVGVRLPADSPLKGALPPDSLIIANNGCGDHLFVRSSDKSGSVYVFWHEEQRHDTFSRTLGELTNPPPASPSPFKPICYSAGQTQVQVGDKVSARDLLLRRDGRIVYLPGVSKKNRQMEHHGLCWVGVKFDRGTFSATIVDPKTFKLKKCIRFLGRSAEPVQELGPEEEVD